MSNIIFYPNLEHVLEFMIQETYRKWWRLLSSIHQNKVSCSAIKIRNWFCLFLFHFLYQMSWNNRDRWGIHWWKNWKKFNIIKVCFDARLFVENCGKNFYSFICSNLLEAAQKGKEVKTQASRGFTDGQQETLLFWKCHKKSSTLIGQTIESLF